MNLEILFALVGVGMSSALGLAYVRYRLGLRIGPRPRGLKRYPSITVIRPIKGMDTGLEHNVRAALDHGYPGHVETFFVFDTREEPAVTVVQRVLDERARDDNPRSSVRILYSGEPPKHRTGKLHAMIHGAKRAGGELIAFADSDTRPDPHTLAVLVETLFQRQDNGSAFVPVSVVMPPKTFGDAGYALLLNALYSPFAAKSARRREGTLPFIMGQMMVFKRGTLKAIGGLESAEGQLVDDMYLGKLVAEAGLRNAVAPDRLSIVEQGIGFDEFWKHFIRWIAFSRSGLPSKELKLGPWLVGVVFWLGALGASGAAFLGAQLAAWALSTVPICVTLMLLGLNRAAGGARLSFRGLAMGLFVFLVGPLVYLKVLLGRTVSWRGRSYALGRDARLERRTALKGDEGADHRAA